MEFLHFAMRNFVWFRRVVVFFSPFFKFSLFRPQHSTILHSDGRWSHRSDWLVHRDCTLLVSTNKKCAAKNRHNFWIIFCSENKASINQSIDRSSSATKNEHVYVHETNDESFPAEAMAQNAAFLFSTDHIHTTRHTFLHLYVWKLVSDHMP